MTLDWAHGQLADGLHKYRAGHFFDAHESWEAVWLASQEPEKSFLQAFIQLAAACHHFQRGNCRGATSLLTSVLRRLEQNGGAHPEVDVVALVDDIRAWLAALETPSALPDDRFPSIRLR